MPNNIYERKIIFRCGPGLYLSVGTVFVLFVCEAIRTGNWRSRALPIGVSAVVLFVLTYLKLEIRRSGLTYRSLITNRSIEFAQIERACLEPASIASESAPPFSIELRNGDRVKIRDGNAVLYIDGNHLSLAGARLAKERIMSAITNIIQRPHL